MASVQAVYHDGQRIDVTGAPVVHEVKCDGCGELLSDPREAVRIEGGYVKAPGRGNRQLRVDLHFYCLGTLPRIVKELLPAPAAGPDPWGPVPKGNSDDEPF